MTVETRNSGPLLLALVALLAVVYPARLALHATGKEKEAAPILPGAKSETEQGGSQEFPTAKALVGQFLHIPLTDRTVPAVSAEPYTIEFLFATVPDPLSSRLPHFFDSFVDSLASAAQAAGYAPDRFWLPWSLKSTATDDDARPGLPALYKTRPGLYLFRRPKDPKLGTRPKLLLIFLVGETPTAGLHKEALFSALDQAAQFYPWDPHHCALPAPFPQPTQTQGVATFRFMAPSFSGSAVSLRTVLDRWLESRAEKPPVKFQIVSGTATAIDVAMLFQGFRGKATFSATVPPDVVTLPRVVEYIQGLQSFGRVKIALLTEGNTAYGQGLKTPGVLTLPYPMHISRLRATLEQARAQQEQAVAAAAGKSPSAHLLSLGAAEEPREVLPSFSELSVASADLMLSNLLSTIARERYQYVGIAATDVRDAIFLAREVRTHCPATALFTINADLLYANADVNSFTRGMIVFTPYPLFNLEQLWTYPYQGSQRRLQFPIGGSEGVYNATLALLGEEKLLIDYGEPLAMPVYASEVSVHKPSLWVTAVGNGEMLPVTLLPWNDRANYTFGALGPEGPGARGLDVSSGVYTQNSVGLVIGLSLGLWAFAPLLLHEQRRRKHSTEQISTPLGDTASPAYRLEGRLFLVCGCATLLALYLVVAGDFCLPLFAARVPGSGVQFTLTSKLTLGLVGLTVLLVAWATHAHFTVFWEAASDPQGAALEVVVAAFLACCLALLFAAVLVIWQFAAALPNWQVAALRGWLANGLFTYLRAFNLGAGLSPLLPLGCVAAGAFLWALCSYRRLRLLDVLRASGETKSRRDWLCFLPLEVPSFRGLAQLESHTKHILESSSVMSLGWYAALASLALLGGGYFFGWRMVRALEPPPFYWLFETAFLIVYWALFMEFIRLIRAWRSLRALLGRLSWHPMLAAYKRYRERFPVLAKVNLTAPPSPFAALESSVCQAGRLLLSARNLVVSGGTDPELCEALHESIPAWETEVKAAEKELADALGHQWQDDLGEATSLVPESARKQRARSLPRDWRRSLECRHRAQRALGQFLQPLGKLLERYWRPHEAGDVRCAATPGAKDFFDQAEEFVVGRVANFLAFVFPPLQNLGYFVLAGLLLMLLAVTSYPFQPRNEFLFFNWVVILVFVGMVFWIFVQMNRDTVLSLLNGTTPGQFNVNREVVLRILLYVVAPVLALLGAQFPEGLQKILSIFAGAPAASG